MQSCPRLRGVARFAAALCPLLLLACAELPTELLGEGGGSTSSGEGGASDVGSTTGPSGSATSGTGGSGGSTGQTASFQISIDDPSPSIELRDEVELTVTVAPNGYVGSIVLGVTGLDAEIPRSISPAMIELDGTTAATARLTLSSLSDSTVGAYGFALNGAAPEGTVSTPATLTVQPVITIYIPPDLASYSGSDTAFGPYPTMIKALPNMSASNTISVRFFNQDSVPREIHASAAQAGFPHGNGPIQPNSFDGQTRNVNQPGTYDYYPHDLNDTSIRGRIIIQ